MRLSVDFSRTIYDGINELEKGNGKGGVQVKCAWKGKAISYWSGASQDSSFEMLKQSHVWYFVLVTVCIHESCTNIWRVVPDKSLACRAKEPTFTVYLLFSSRYYWWLDTWLKILKLVQRWQYVCYPWVLLASIQRVPKDRYFQWWYIALRRKYCEELRDARVSQQ